MDYSKYKKRPVVVEAIKWTGSNLREVITFCDGPPDTRTMHAGLAWESYEDLVARDGLKIYTLEGKMIASIGDWIIRGVKGECYPCKPDIFTATYEAVDADRATQEVPDSVWEALQRLIENGTMLGPASREDAMVVARHRDRVRFMVGKSAPPVAWALKWPLDSRINPSTVFDSMAEAVWCAEGYTTTGITVVPLYAAAQPVEVQRVPLTVDDLWKNDALMALNAEIGLPIQHLEEIVAVIEAAHGIKPASEGGA